MSAMHLAAIAMWGSAAPHLVWIYGIGILTSLLNHGLHKEDSGRELLRIADRAWMVVGFGSDVWCSGYLGLVGRAGACGCIAVYCICFAVAKRHIQVRGHKAHNGPHLGTHLTATLLHVYFLRHFALGAAAVADPP